MKKATILCTAILVLTTVLATAQQNQKDFFGMWTLEIEGGSVGWLGIDDSKGYLDAELLWKGGSVTPVSFVYFLDENTLIVTRSREIRKDEERKHIMTQTYKFKREGEDRKSVV